MSTFTAQNMGAGRPERVRRGYRAAYAITGIFALLIGLILFFFDKQIIGAFMNSQSGGTAFATGTGYLYRPEGDYGRSPAGSGRCDGVYTG